MTPAHRLVLKGKASKNRVIVTVLLALSCVVGLLLIEHRNYSSGTLVRVKYRTTSGHSETVQEHVRDLAADPTSNEQLIPQVLHHVYLDGLDSLHKAEQAAGPYVGQKFPGYNSTLRRSCPRIHHEWQYMFWNLSQAEGLIQASYPWFLDTFRTYETNVQKGDAFRPLLMHAIGGLYVDIDVECLTPTDPLLNGREIVLQLENEDSKSLNNAVMASIPGHPFWIVVMELLIARRSYANGWFQCLGFKESSTILHSTGPDVMRDAFKTFTREAGDLQLGWAGEWDIKGSRFQVYPVGQWFEPCKWDDYKCHQRVQGAQHLPPSLVGHHINSGAWLRDMKSHNRKLLLKWLGAFSTFLMTCACCVYMLSKWRERSRDLPGD